MQKLIFPFIFMLALSGCAGVMNPYSSSFQCPKMENGKCVSVRTAYNESTEEKDYHDLWAEGRSGKKEKEPLGPSDADLYQSALYGRLNGLLQSPRSPMVVPPQVMRVLILPYTGADNDLYMYRYVYMFLDGPRWLLKNAISQEAVR